MEPQPPYRDELDERQQPGEHEAAHRPSRARSAATGFKRVALVVLGALIALFAVFNSRDVDVRWIFGDPIQTPLILVIVISLVVGIAIGWLAAILRGRH